MSKEEFLTMLDDQEVRAKLVSIVNQTNEVTPEQMAEVFKKAFPGGWAKNVASAPSTDPDHQLP